jgi:hypothetical protein
MQVAGGLGYAMGTIFSFLQKTLSLGFRNLVCEEDACFLIVLKLNLGYPSAIWVFSTIILLCIGHRPLECEVALPFVALKS